MSQSLKNINQKILSLQDAVQTVQSWKNKGNIIVFTNGCFDLLHRGHIEYLSKAADLGDKLVIGLNSDQSVKLLNKGSNRPIQNENDRAFLLAALQFVDLVVIFNEATPLNLIQTIKPNVLVKGGDYDKNITDLNHPQYIVGSDFVKNNNGKVEVIPFTEGYSSSKIINKIKS